VHQSDEVYLYTARNLSVGGMFIDTPVPLPAGTSLALEFRLPDGMAFETIAEVRWNTEVAAPGTRVKHPGMGVVFTKLPDEGHHKLLSWVEGS